MTTEIPLKQWCAEEAQREKLSNSGILWRIHRGRYPGIRLRYVNQRVVFVQTPSRALERP